MMTETGKKPASRTEIGRARRAKTRANIIAAAFDLFGSENGLYTRVEDIAARANVTRATFYNHFSGMVDLRDAVTHELMHEFLVAVRSTIQKIDDPRIRMSVATRYYLHRARKEPAWGWSILNLSANGILFGAETYKQAEITVQEGMDAGLLHVQDSRVGRDMILGTSLAAISSMLQSDPGADYPEKVAEHMLLGLGVEATSARTIGYCDLPPLPR